MSAPFPADRRLTSFHVAEQLLDWLTGTDPVEERATWLEAFSVRTPAPEELVLLVQALRARMHPVDLQVNRLRGPLIDVCGTGGDRAGLFNISTATAFVTAGAGAVVAKHGNRAVTSTSGTADALEALGIPVEQTPELAARSLEQKRFAFLFAPGFHPAFKMIGPVRKALAEKGVPTVFNIFGPLLNPARPRRQLIGVSDPVKAKVLAEICQQMDYAAVWVVSGEIDETGGHMDEISICGRTHVFEVKQGQLHEFMIDPLDHGLALAPLSALKGADPKVNAALIEKILAGEAEGPAFEIVVLNSAAALVVAGIVDEIGEGIQRAKTSILSGSAKSVLDSVRGAAGSL